MNILPKKSWHVRTKKNIERVRRDEAEAAEKEKEKQRRIAIAESEARTEALRAGARKRRRSGDDDDESERQIKRTYSPSNKHINFFEAEEQGKQSGGTNAEYEAEKKQEREKEEKAIGLLTYLGQSAVESQTDKPWYYKPPDKYTKTEEKSSVVKLNEEFDLKHKWNQDPMKHVTKYLLQKEKIEKRDKGSNVPTVSALAHDRRSVHTSNSAEPKSSNHSPTRHHVKKKKEKHRKKDKKHKKHKKHKREKHGIAQCEKSAAALPTSDTLQVLRAERLRRERQERRRTEDLLAQVHGTKPQPANPPPDDRDRRYNSQFNPEFIRKKKTKPYR